MNADFDMKVNSTLEAGVLTVAVTGGLDSITSPRLAEEIAAKADSADSVVFDFEKLEYISSAGIRVIVSTVKKMSEKGGVSVKNPSGVVTEVFELVGMTELINIG